MAPKVILFDIGGVCVVSPMSAILNYETAHSLPLGYINTAISMSGPQGAWARVERGEIPLDATFFEQFTSDLSSPAAWKHFSQPGPPPKIDGEPLFWAMMGAARVQDPFVYPALERLRAHADQHGGFIVAACSNTVIYPDGHDYANPESEMGRFTARLRALFHLFVSSAHVGHRKPEPEIYAYTLRECERTARERGVLRKDEQLDPKDVVFLDDIGSNLRGARKAGIGKGIKVVMGRTEDAVKELETVTGLQLRDKARL